jgi:hypothetical protein
MLTTKPLASENHRRDMIASLPSGGALQCGRPIGIAARRAEPRVGPAVGRLSALPIASIYRNPEVIPIKDDEQTAKSG